MTFLKYNDSDGWWEFDKSRMMAYNVNGGHHNVTEDDINEAVLFTCDNWHQLYLCKKYCPIETNVKCADVWISPDGKFYEGKAHAVQAEKICDIIYGLSDLTIWQAESWLNEHNWIKATTSIMWNYYVKDIVSNANLTTKQKTALYDWCNIHGTIFPDVFNDS
ncbi:hypothetical protein J6A31_08995 [bacterium]|nr:hypothetical protein [bacterium]